MTRNVLNQKARLIADDCARDELDIPKHVYLNEYFKTLPGNEGKRLEIAYKNARARYFQKLQRREPYTRANFLTFAS